MRKISICIIAFVALIFLVTPVYAATLGEIWDTADNWLAEEQSSSIINETALEGVSNSLYNILLGIGVAIAIIVGFVLAIQFMMAGVEGKAQVKEALIAYSIGCVVIFGAFGIWKISVNLLNNMQTKTNYCENGKHLFDSKEDTICNVCGYFCKHENCSLETSNDGIYTTCTCYNCGAKLSRNLCVHTPKEGTITSNNGREFNATCSKCGEKFSYLK